MWHIFWASCSVVALLCPLLARCVKIVGTESALHQLFIFKAASVHAKRVLPYSSYPTTTVLTVSCVLFVFTVARAGTAVSFFDRARITHCAQEKERRNLDHDWGRHTKKHSERERESKPGKVSFARAPVLPLRYIYTGISSLVDAMRARCNGDERAGYSCVYAVMLPMFRSRRKGVEVHAHSISHEKGQQLELPAAGRQRVEGGQMEDTSTGIAVVLFDREQSKVTVAVSPSLDGSTRGSGHLITTSATKAAVSIVGRNTTNNNNAFDGGKGGLVLSSVFCATHPSRPRASQLPKDNEPQAPTLVPVTIVDGTGGGQILNGITPLLVKENKLTSTSSSVTDEQQQQEQNTHKQKRQAKSSYRCVCFLARLEHEPHARSIARILYR